MLHSVQLRFRGTHLTVNAFVSIVKFNINVVSLSPHARCVRMTLTTHPHESILSILPHNICVWSHGTHRTQTGSSHLTWMIITIRKFIIDTHLLRFDGTNTEIARHCQARRWIPPEPKNTLFCCSILLERRAQTSPAGSLHQHNCQSSTLWFLSCHHRLAKAASPSKTVREKRKTLIKMLHST